jgi:hypothetical protein
MAKLKMPSDSAEGVKASNRGQYSDFREAEPRRDERKSRSTA